MPPCVTKSTRGIRNNNPGNLKSGNVPYVGKIGRDADGFDIFDTPHNGIRAIGMALLHMQRRDGLKTVRQMITVYSTTDQRAYVNNVADALRVSPDEPINICDGDDLADMMAAIIYQENGQQPYGYGAIQLAALDAKEANNVAIA